MRLALERLSLSHFRSHKSATIDSDGGITAIYGPNGAGKTNILEAISMLSPGRGLRRAKPDEMMRSPEALGWKVKGNLVSLAQRHELETSYTGSGSRSVLIDGKSAPQIALGRVARIVWLVPVMDRIWVEGAEGRRRFLDRMALSFFPNHAELSLTYEKAMRNRNRMLKDGIDDPSWYEAIEVQMAQAGIAIETNRQETISRLSGAQGSDQSEFPTAELELLAPEGKSFETEEALCQAFRTGRPVDMRAGRTLIGPHRSDMHAVYKAKDIPAKLCSTGEQKALLVSLILANGRALAQDFGAAPIFLLDEIAAHLDVDRRAALYREISELGAQAWMTGTGAELFEELDEDAQLLEVTEGPEGSAIKQG